MTHNPIDASVSLPLDGWHHNLPSDQAAIMELWVRAELAADRIEALEKALEPFAAMGRVMEARAKMTLGRTPPDSEIVCESSGEVGMGILVMGHFRDATAMLPNAPGWGGVYRPARTLLTQDQSNG